MQMGLRIRTGCLGVHGSGLAHDAGGISGYDRTRRDVLGDDAPSANQSPFTDRHPAQDGRTGSDGGASLHHGGLAMPILFGLHGTIRIRRSWPQVIDERHVVPDEHFVLDGYSLADESMAGDLAAMADGRPFLNLNKCPDLTFVANLATIQVDESKDFGSLADLDPWSDPLEKGKRSGFRHCAFSSGWRLGPHWVSDSQRARRSRYDPDSGQALLLRHCI